MIIELIPSGTRRKISTVLFFAAIVLAIPPLPWEFFSDIFLNLPLATYLSNQFGFTLLNALIATYTIVPIILIYIGSVIRPTNTMITFNGQFTKLKLFFIKYINLVKKNPLHLVWIVVSYFILLRVLGFYQTQINIYVFS